MTAKKAKTSKKSGRRLWLAPALAAFLVGLGAGVGAWMLLQPVVEGHDEAEVHVDPTKSVSETQLVRSELEIGRIVVSLPGSEDRRSRLLIDPVVVYRGHVTGALDESDQEDADGFHAAPGSVPARLVEFRDVFIEYLSQLKPGELQGSHGMVGLRAELLRRARIVAGEDVIEVLIQDFMVQR